MKYPCTVLAEEGASGKCISIAVAHAGVIQDAGAKMIHLAPNTKSQIISKSIAHGGGEANYRGTVKISKKAINSLADIRCDTILLDSLSKSDTFPIDIIENEQSFLKHEAKVTQLDEEKMFYAKSRGIDSEKARHLLVMGFIEPFTNELPMEYAVELNRLLGIDIAS
jgi:Fe-S cluster assembly protein SufB